MSRILLNGLHYERNGAGISKYNEMLIKTFINENYDIDILVRNQYKDEFISDKVKKSKNDINGSKERIIYEQINSLKLYKNYDMVHFPDYATPIFYGGIKLATIHDMAMYTMKDKRTFKQNLTKNILLKNTVNHADKLICVSQFAKRELLNYYPNVEHKVEVIYEGIKSEIAEFSMKEQNEVLNKYNIEKKRYILYVGTIAPHKNIKLLIRAFSHIYKKIPGFKLVIAGNKGWMYKDIFKEVENLKMHDDIIFTDRIEQSELEILYKNASLFTSISLYEGFGFPPLEAMIRRIPVLVSDIDIFKEICTDCVLYCNPNEIEDIGSKILKIIYNEKLQRELIKKASERVKFFDWKKTARETYGLYCRMI